MIEIECPDCQSVGKMSLAQTLYEGPYRCWKCRSLYKIVLANDKLQSIEPITEEELEAWQELNKLTRRDSDD
ncbi:MAG: hypothetical protein PVG61_02055 [Dehalococcoidia bacterium]